MVVFDCNKYFNKSNADVFQSISCKDLQSLQIEAQECQGIFKPVTTDTSRPIRAALVALNGYAGEDASEFVTLPNPMVEACLTHPPLVVKLPAVIEKYRSGVPVLTEAAFYFTNFVKVYPPDKFQKADVMDSVLKKCPRMTALFRQYLMDEIIGLVKDECRIFICFGIVASRYFMETFQSYTNAPLQATGTLDQSNKVHRCIIDGKKVFVVSAYHFSCRKGKSAQEDATEYLASVLAKEYNV